MVSEISMNLAAIAKSLQERLPKDIVVKVYFDKNCLKVVLEATQAPMPSVIRLLGIDELSDSTLLPISPLKVKVYGHQRNAFEVDWVRQFILNNVGDISFSTKLSKCRISHEDEGKNESNKAQYNQVLYECGQSAHEAFQRASLYYREFEKNLISFERKLNISITNLTHEKSSSNFEFSRVLEEIESTLHDEISDKLDKLEESLRTQRQHLSKFTVVLFGRTKAGKSTLREALTKGDGSTIGKGLQRTTRDIKEYYWNGLRLFDTPGIEAYQGDEDKQKAQKIACESDMVIFLASDDSMQPDEFAQMAWVQDINKYFFIVLNTKYIEKNIEDPKRLKRFIQKLKSEVFDEQRLSEHKRHICSQVKSCIGLKQIEIICIHAHAAFLSSTPEYADYADEMWQLSRVDAVYQQIISEIKSNGIKRRWDSMFDAVLRHTNELVNNLERQYELLEAQLDFLYKKKHSLENILLQQHRNGNHKLEATCKEEFRRIKQWIPGFVEDYLGKNDAQAEYRRRIEKEEKQIEASMEKTLDEILNDLINAISEFQHQYQYDSTHIKIDFSNFRKDKGTGFGDFLKWTGVGLGVISGVAFGLSCFAAANFWNPVGWIASGASLIVGLFSNHVRAQEEKAWNQAKQNVMESLLKDINQAEVKTLKLYTQLFKEKIIDRANKDVIGQIQTYISGINQINCMIQTFTNQIKTLNKDMDRERKNR